MENTTVFSSPGFNSWGRWTNTDLLGMITPDVTWCRSQPDIGIGRLKKIHKKHSSTFSAHVSLIRISIKLSVTSLSLAEILRPLKGMAGLCRKAIIFSSWICVSLVTSVSSKTFSMIWNVLVEKQEHTQSKTPSRQRKGQNICASWNIYIKIFTSHLDHV